MSNKNFFIQLTLLSALAAAGLFFANTLPEVEPYANWSWFSLLFFATFSALIYFSVRRSATNPNKNTFTNAVLGMTMGKMLLCAIVVLAYHKIAQPESKWFLLPFFSAYVIFTAFETYLMMKLARVNA